MSWIGKWNKLLYGWDLDTINDSFWFVPDLNHWLVNEPKNNPPNFIEEKFAQQVEAKKVKAIIFKVSDANNKTGQLFFDPSAELWYRLANKYKLGSGGFHWLQPSVDPKVAWNFYYGWMRDHPCTMPYILDFEEKKIQSATDIVWRATQWFSHANAAWGSADNLCYTGMGYIDFLKGMLIEAGKNWVNVLSPLAQQPLWLAMYTRYWPKIFVQKYMKYRIYDGKELWPWSGFEAWQYSPNADYEVFLDEDNENAQAWGFESKGLDMNYFNAGWLSKYLFAPQLPPADDPPAQPPPAGDPPAPPVDDTLTAALQRWETNLTDLAADIKSFRETKKV